MDFIHPKLKKLITEKIDEDLLKKRIVTYKDEFWILETENTNWFLYFDATNSVYYNQKFFQTYRDVFSVNSSQLSTIIREWVENRLGVRVTCVSRRQSNLDYIIEGMIRSEKGKWTLENRFGFGYELVKRYLNLKKVCGEILVEDFMIS